MTIEYPVTPETLTPSDGTSMAWRIAQLEAQLADAERARDLERERREDYENSYKHVCDERDAVQARLAAMLAKIREARYAMTESDGNMVHEHIVMMWLDAIRDAGQVTK